MHNAAMAAMGLNCRYLAFDVPPDELGPAIAGAKAMRFLGLNLTVPHKLLALPMMDELDETARKWGAVNTVRFEGKNAAGVWVPLLQCPADYSGPIRTRGFNTDAEAIARSLREDLGLQLEGAKVLLLGAGGAGRVAALKLAETGVKELYLFNRTGSKAVELTREIRVKYPKTRVEADYPVSSVDLIINATSVGLKPGDGSPLDHLRFPFEKTGAVYDMIYRPAETPFLVAAKAAGCRVANGIGMLLYQGTAAFERWMEAKAPIEAMARALKRHIYGQKR